MANSGGVDRPPADWRWLVVIALVIGVAPAVGRTVTAELREPWGWWPAMLAGTAVAALIALVVLGAAWLVTRPRGPGGPG